MTQVSETLRPLADARRAVHEALVVLAAPEADRVRELVTALEEAVAGREAEKLAEARMWARHGYETGQRHCSWSDFGVAPAWLTEGWPQHFPACATCRDRGIVPDHGRPYDHNGELYPKPCPECGGT